MRHLMCLLWALLAFGLLAVLAGCGEGGSSLRVSVNPTDATIRVNETQQFTALVKGSDNLAVTWSTTGGNITGSGLYTAPASEGTYQIMATCVADPSVSAVATITVRKVVVRINQSYGSLIDLEGTMQLSATVVGSTNTDVLWRVESGDSGTISNTGLFTASGIAGTCLISATSVADPDSSATIAIEVSDLNTPPTAAFTASHTSADVLSPIKFDASGCEDQQDDAATLLVRWDLNGDGNWDTDYSTDKTTSRLYTLPGTYNVTLQVKDSRGVTSSMTMPVIINLALGVSPLAATINVLAPLQFTAYLSGDANKEVIWSVVEPNGGTITANGLYTAPDTAGVYTVKVTTVATPTTTMLIPVTVQAITIDVEID